jgi:hypothetical protein
VHPVQSLTKNRKLPAFALKNREFEIEKTATIAAAFYEFTSEP